MRYILRWFDRLNRKFDRLPEPRRILTILLPFLTIVIASGLIEVFTDDKMWSVISTMLVPLFVCFGGLWTVCFRMGLRGIDKDWLYTHTVGLPYRFRHSVEIHNDSLYYYKERRDEITKWVSGNTKLYRGEFVPTGKATFYFMRKVSAMEFKLRW